MGQRVWRTGSHEECSMRIAPEHYRRTSRECIDTIRGALTQEEFMGFCIGNALKYICRYRYKGDPVGDLNKAADYIGILKDEIVLTPRGKHGKGEITE